MQILQLQTKAFGISSKHRRPRLGHRNSKLCLGQFALYLTQINPSVKIRHIFKIQLPNPYQLAQGIKQLLPERSY